jgi:hypothetical protein
MPESISEHAKAVEQMVKNEEAMKHTVAAMSERPTTQGDPPEGSLEDLEAHPWKKEKPPADPMDEPMLKFFQYCHLPTPLQIISSPFYDLAHELVRSLPRNPERTVALRKLLEAKDCAVRAMPAVRAML